MAKQLRTKTEYDFTRLKELQWVVANGIAPEVSKKQRTAMYGLGAVCLLGGGALLAFAKWVIPAVILFAVGAFFLVWGIFFFSLRALTAGRAMQLNKRRVINEFVMEKENILVYLDNKSTRYPYSKCRQVLEAELALYVIMDEGQGLMLDKSGVTGGTADDLRRWLEEKCAATTRWVGRGAQPD